MYLIQEVLVSDDIMSTQFVCNLSKCKGACCVEGDFGAPLDESEKEIIAQILPEVIPHMSENGIKAINEKGVWQNFSDDTHVFPGTTLMEDGACAFVNYDADGVANCSIEKAWSEGKTSFKKPISCHLYPIRYSEVPQTSFRALNYDKWEICNPACSLGEALKIPVFRFLKESIIRKFGQDFYSELEHASEHSKFQ
jgi:hypothetical protein